MRSIIRLLSPKAQVCNFDAFCAQSEFANIVKMYLGGGGVYTGMWLRFVLLKEAPLKEAPS